MKASNRWLPWFALVPLLALSAAPAFAQGSGTVTHKGVSMPVTHAVAVWWDDPMCPVTKCLQVYLLPFAPSAQETALMQKGYPTFFLSRPGPDPKKWPKQSPYALMELNWSRAKEGVGRFETADATFEVAFIAGETVLNNFSRFAGDLAGTISGDFKLGGTITLQSAGTSARKDWPDTTAIAYDFKVTTKILPATKKVK
jgi:hypothetical protein